MEGIQVSVENAGPNNDISIIKVGGYIDTTTSAELEHQLSSLIKQNAYNIIIDLGNVDYISSAGWGIFISEIKGIREQSGDLKLARMIPDVYEVFELLEFHYILKAFDSVEEAVSDFELSASGGTTLQPPLQSGSQQHQSQVASETKSKVLEADEGFAASESNDTIEEKLRQIIVENPDAGTFQLIKTLNTPRFGNIKLGWFEIRKYLKQLSLESKKKRIAYFKQKSFS